MINIFETVHSYVCICLKTTFHCLLLQQLNLGQVHLFPLGNQALLTGSLSFFRSWQCSSITLAGPLESNMQSLRDQRQLINPLSPAWLLSCILLTMLLALPVLTIGSLECNFCPLQVKGEPCPNITTQCLPDQRCASSRGHFGGAHILSAQSCVNLDLCGSHRIKLFRGTNYNVSYTCCCADLCNQKPRPDTHLKDLLGLTTGRPVTSFGYLTNAPMEEPWDSCLNFSSGPVTAAIPAHRRVRSIR